MTVSQVSVTLDLGVLTAFYEVAGGLNYRDTGMESKRLRVLVRVLVSIPQGLEDIGSLRTVNGMCFEPV